MGLLFVYRNGKQMGILQKGLDIKHSHVVVLRLVIYLSEYKSYLPERILFYFNWVINIIIYSSYTKHI